MKLFNQKKYVAFTFDDGPSFTDVTTHILNILKNNNSKATFFVKGYNAYCNPKKIIDIVSANCEIGNHTWNHENLYKLTSDEIIKSIKTTQETIEKITNIKPILARTTGGNINIEIFNILKNFNLFSINWNVDTEDWKSRDTNTIINKTLNDINDNAIIIMHDIYKETADAFEIIVKELIKQKYILVTVSELMKINKINLQYNKIYFSGKKLKDVR